MTISPEDPVLQIPEPSPSSAWKRLTQRYRSLPFVLPFAVFILSGFLEPSVPAEPEAVRSAVVAPSKMPASESPEQDERSQLLSYPLAYTLRIALTGMAVLLVLPTWRVITWRCSWWAVAVGLGGGVLWIGVCRLKIEDQVLMLVGLDDWASLGDRPGFDPYGSLGAAPFVMVSFLAVRLVGLTLIVPLIEEFFLRGFLMRFIEKPDWWTIELGSVGGKAALAATAYGVLAHPAEPIAAVLWFSLITLLYARTRSIWDCVVAHGVTNATLGFYILTFRDWTLW